MGNAFSPGGGGGAPQTDSRMSEEAVFQWTEGGANFLTATSGTWSVPALAGTVAFGSIGSSRYLAATGTNYYARTLSTVVARRAGFRFAVQAASPAPAASQKMFYGAGISAVFGSTLGVSNTRIGFEWAQGTNGDRWYFVTCDGIAQTIVDTGLGVSALAGLLNVLSYDVSAAQPGTALWSVRSVLTGDRIASGVATATMPAETTPMHVGGTYVGGVAAAYVWMKHKPAWNG